MANEETTEALRFPKQVERLFQEIDRLHERKRMVVDRAESGDDEAYYSFDTVRDILVSGTREGAAFKRAVRDLSFQVDSANNALRNVRRSETWSDDA